MNLIVLAMNGECLCWLLGLVILMYIKNATTVVEDVMELKKLNEAIAARDGLEQMVDGHIDGQPPDVVD